MISTNGYLTHPVPHVTATKAVLDPCRFDPDDHPLLLCRFYGDLTCSRAQPGYQHSDSIHIHGDTNAYSRSIDRHDHTHADELPHTYPNIICANLHRDAHRHLDTNVNSDHHLNLHRNNHPHGDLYCPAANEHADHYTYALTKTAPG